MQNLFLGDYPPVPECFSHLLDRGNEEHSMYYYQRPLHHDTDDERKVEAVSITNQNNGKSESLSPVPESKSRIVKSVHQEEDLDESTVQGTFRKLNFSLGKLQQEMKDLRNLDISLFYQLLALNEAIQDFKINASDRFSETGSEYSLGTASYMGSMSSLNDDSDWAEEGTILNSPQLDGNDTLLAQDRNSTTELLMQITDLAMRADQDF